MSIIQTKNYFEQVQTHCILHIQLKMTLALRLSAFPNVISPSKLYLEVTNYGAAVLPIFQAHECVLLLFPLVVSPLLTYSLHLLSLYILKPPTYKRFPNLLSSRSHKNHFLLFCNSLLSMFVFR